jgi:hypothetical protein
METKLAAANMRRIMADMIILPGGFRPLTVRDSGECRFAHPCNPRQ